MIIHRIREVGPQEAQVLLDGQVANRSISRRMVAQYLRDMEAGRWEPASSDILINTEGQLEDGQTRLTAIVEFGAPVKLGVKTGCPVGVGDYVDNGRVRTNADVLERHGIEQAKVSGRTLAKIAGYKAGGGFNLSHGGVMSHAEAIEGMKDPKNVAAIEAALRYRTPFPKDWIGFFWSVFAEKDIVMADKFFTYLSDGAGLPSGHPVLTLRNAYLARAAGRRRPSVESTFIATTFAWNAFREGRTLSKIQFDVKHKAGAKRRSPSSFPTAL